jgi:hypothetical protein
MSSDYSKSRAIMTGASRPLEFIDGTVYQMRPLRDCDIAEADHWLQARFLKIGRAGFTSKEDEERLYPGLVARAMNLSMVSGEGAEMMASLDGFAYLIVLSCRQDHPDITVESVREKLVDANNIREFNEKWRMLNATPRPTEPAAPASKKKSRARKSTANLLVATDGRTKRFRT